MYHTEYYSIKENSWYLDRVSQTMEQALDDGYDKSQEGWYSRVISPQGDIIAKFPGK